MAFPDEKAYNCQKKIHKKCPLDMSHDIGLLLESHHHTISTRANNELEIENKESQVIVNSHLETHSG